MARSWDAVRAEAAPLLDEQRIANERKLLTEAVRAHRLAEVRKQQEVSQVALAEAMHVSQSRVSKIERGDLAHTELGTLQCYVEALGGHLRVVADFGDQTLVVQ